MYLVDTNVWLERLLNQEKSKVVELFFTMIPSEYLHVTDFTFHSIGVVLSRLQQLEALRRFVQDVFLGGAVGLLRLEPGDIPHLIQIIGQFQLDFDDPYQYLAA